MPMSDERACPDCSSVMRSIKLIDKSHAGEHTALEYTVPEARRSFWTGTYPVEGKVNAMMCGECGRIALYGDPKAGG
jgi:hypothetical protein